MNAHARTEAALAPSWMRKGGVLAAACVLGWAIQCWFVGLGFVPTTSMEGALLQGDWVVVLRGAGNASSTVGQILPGSERRPVPRGSIVAVAQREDLAAPPLVSGRERLRADEERREVAEARPPSMDAQSAQVTLVKRVVGLPGERVHVRGGVLQIDGAPEDAPVTIRSLYRVNSEKPIDELAFYQLGISSVRRDGAVYVVGPAGLAEAAAMRAWPGVSHVARCGGCTTERGSWIVPEKGVPVRPRNREEAQRVAHLIQSYETRAAVVDPSGSLVVEGERLSEYAFREDYYFVAGDNRPESRDSRSWGPVPASSLRGRVVLVAASWDWFRRAPRWDRFGKGMGE